MYIRIYTTTHCRFCGRDGGKETMEQGASSTTCLETPDLHLHHHLHDTLDLTAIHPTSSCRARPAATTSFCCTNYLHNATYSGLRQCRGFLTLPTAHLDKVFPLLTAQMHAVMSMATFPLLPSTHYIIYPQSPMMRVITLNSGTE